MHGKDAVGVAQSGRVGTSGLAAVRDDKVRGHASAGAVTQSKSQPNESSGRRRRWPRNCHRWPRSTANVKLPTASMANSWAGKAVSESALISIELISTGASQERARTRRRECRHENRRCLAGTDDSLPAPTRRETTRLLRLPSPDESGWISDRHGTHLRAGNRRSILYDRPGQAKRSYDRRGINDRRVEGVWGVTTTVQKWQSKGKYGDESSQHGVLRRRFEGAGIVPDVDTLVADCAHADILPSAPRATGTPCTPYTTAHADQWEIVNLINRAYLVESHFVSAPRIGDTAVAELIAAREMLILRADNRAVATAHLRVREAVGHLGLGIRSPRRTGSRHRATHHCRGRRCRLCTGGRRDAPAGGQSPRRTPRVLSAPGLPRVSTRCLTRPRRHLTACVTGAWLRVSLSRRPLRVLPKRWLATPLDSEGRWGRQRPLPKPPPQD